MTKTSLPYLSLRNVTLHRGLWPISASRLNRGRYIDSAPISPYFLEDIRSLLSTASPLEHQVLAVAQRHQVLVATSNKIIIEKQRTLGEQSQEVEYACQFCLHATQYFDGVTMFTSCICYLEWNLYFQKEIWLERLIRVESSPAADNSALRRFFATWSRWAYG